MLQAKEVFGRSLIDGSVTLSSGGLALLFCADVVSPGIFTVSEKEECSISFFFSIHLLQVISRSERKSKDNKEKEKKTGNE